MELLKNGFFGMTIAKDKKSGNNIWERRIFDIKTNVGFTFTFRVFKNKETNETEYNITFLDKDKFDVIYEDLLDEINLHKLEDLF